MKFEIINMFDKVVHTITLPERIPPKSQLNSMIKAGYKFRLDGKLLSKKKLDELVARKGKSND